MLWDPQELEVEVETGVGATDYSEVARLESLSGAPSISDAVLLVTG